MGEYGHSLSVTKHAFFGFIVYGASKHYPNIQGVSKYPNMWTSNMQGVHQNIWGIQTYRGCIKTYGASKHTRGVQTYWSIQTYRMHPHIWGNPNVWGAYGHSLHVTKHAFFVFCTYGASKHYPNIQGVSKHLNMGTSKHVGEIQIYRSVHTYSGGIQT